MRIFIRTVLDGVLTLEVESSDSHGLFLDKIMEGLKKKMQGGLGDFGGGEGLYGCILYKDGVKLDLSDLDASCENLNLSKETMLNIRLLFKKDNPLYWHVLFGHYTQKEVAREIDGDDSQIGDMQGQNEVLQGENEVLQGQNDVMQRQIADMQRQIADMQGQNEVLQGQNEVLQGENVVMQRQIDELAAVDQRRLAERQLHGAQGGFSNFRQPQNQAGGSKRRKKKKKRKKNRSNGVAIRNRTRKKC